ncbi:hypothetical protein [Halovenus salina]|uniref:ABC-2 type transport system permease protein n=1 Tax=Halovenus salina TaxID=1510225 RepID=A0ABD5W540_9EURY
MRRLLSLTVTLLRDWTRNREAVFFALLFPLILLVIFSFVFAGGPTEFEVAVQNNDIEGGEPTALSAEFVDAVERVEPLAVERIDANVSLGEADIEEATGYKRVLVVPDGFDERVRTESARVRATVIRDTLDRFRGNISADQQADALEGLDALGAENGTTGPARIQLLTVPDDQGPVRSGASSTASLRRSTTAQSASRSRRRPSKPNSGATRRSVPSTTFFRPSSWRWC